MADFSRLLRSAGQRQSVAIFLDAIDQLRDIGDPPQLDWLPRALPHGVRLVISVLKGPPFDAIHRHLAASRVIQVPPMPARDGEALLRTWLRRSGRALQPRQRLAIARRFTRSGLPLYLRLAFEEARRWRSFDRPVVARDLDGMVGQLMGRLAQPVAHGTVLVRRSMAYLLASRKGLADEEALGLLSRDREVVADFAQRMPDSPQTRELPPILWSRWTSTFNRTQQPWLPAPLGCSDSSIANSPKPSRDVMPTAAVTSRSRTTLRHVDCT